MQLSSSAHILCNFLQHGEYSESKLLVNEIARNAYALTHCKSGDYRSYAKSVKVTQAEERQSCRYDKANRCQSLAFNF